MDNKSHLKQTELLAPAKDKYTAIEAINCGADAVYIGASSFGARKNAQNSLEDIKDVVDYAHKYWAKVFVTLNTILDDNELIEATTLALKLDKIGVDAILVQDMGLFKNLIELTNNKIINIPIHMSTQCDNRDINKISFFNEMGVSRVVLARELSLAQIKKIHDKNPTLELEAFVHGALCVSYSGNCYLSQYIGNRSANKGECAQPCRKKYAIITDKNEIIAKDIHALCLKDFNASEYIKEMIDSGIYSFKIEGRLKDINYVKNIVSYYRNELDKYSRKVSSGKVFLKFIPNPEKSFNRGFTDYFLEQRKDCFNFVSPKSRGEYIGKTVSVKNLKDKIIIETNKKFHVQDGLCFENNGKLDGFLINKLEKNNNTYIITPNKHVNINKGTLIYRNQDVEFEKIISSCVKRQIGVKITVEDDFIKLIDEDNNNISIQITSKEKANNQDKMNEIFIQQFNKTGESEYYIENIKLSQNIPFMKISEINDFRRVALNELTEKRIKNYKRDVQKRFKYTNYYLKEVDYRANVHNNTAERFYNQCNCNVKERSFESKKPNRQVELMRTKHCIKYALNICKSSKNLIMVDEFGTKYPLRFDCKNCEMVVLSPEQNS